LHMGTVSPRCSSPFALSSPPRAPNMMILFRNGSESHPRQCLEREKFVSTSSRLPTFNTSGCGMCSVEASDEYVSPRVLVFKPLVGGQQRLLTCLRVPPAEAKAPSSHRKSACAFPRTRMCKSRSLCRMSCSACSPGGAPGGMQLHQDRQGPWQRGNRPTERWL
jgi:hypothetical protein